MNVAEIMEQRNAFSFEVFPPKTDVGMEKLCGEGGVLEKLYTLNPDYISCTYGAGGTNVGKNLEVLKKIKADGKCTPVTHFTCVANTKEGIKDQLQTYLFDVYRDRAPAARNVLDFSLYVTFFPKLVSGPIVQYAEMEPQLRDHPVTREGFGSGARLFLIGLAKKVLLANTLGTTFYALSALPMTQLSTLSAWLGAVCYALMLYFDFSGYSDMAIGLASMFGFRFGKNFDYPYVSQSITEFWRRWHISLGAWFRDYVYIPCGGSRAGTVRTIANLLLVWLLTGIWHGANWTFLLWGVYYGILLLLEKFVLRRVLEHLPGLLRHVLTLLLVLIGWVFFFSSSPAAAFGWIGRMFGSGSALVDATAKYYLAGCWPLLLVGAIGSFPVVSHVGTNLLRRSKAWQAFSVVLFLALLLLCIALMMNDTYSTFLYFQF